MSKAERPAPVKLDFSSSGFVGEPCPLCRSNRLLFNYRFPVCQHCRDKYDLTLEFLEKLKHFRLKIDQEEIDWGQKPNPKLTGTINSCPWTAQLVLNGHWQIHWVDGKAPAGIVSKQTLGTLIKQLLDAITPNYVERLHGKTTKIRRHHLLIAVGLGAAVTLATAGYLATLRDEKKRQEEAEALESNDSQ